MAAATIKMDAVAESERKEKSPRVSIKFNLGMENKWTDTGRDSRTYLARSNPQARTRTGGKIFSLSC